MTELAHCTVTTRFPTEADAEASTIYQLTALINEVYDDAESGMWRHPGMRTNPGEVEPLLRSQALILAEIDGMLVGSVNVNLRLVQQAYQRISAGDIPSFLTLLADNVQWKVPAMTNVPFAGTWQGRQHVGEFFRKVAEAQERVEFTPEHVIAQDDKVVVLGHLVNRVKATGKESRSEWAQVWTVKDGVITHMQEYVDTAAVSQAHMG